MTPPTHVRSIKRYSQFKEHLQQSTIGKAYYGVIGDSHSSSKCVNLLWLEFSLLYCMTQSSIAPIPCMRAHCLHWRHVYAFGKARALQFSSLHSPNSICSSGIDLYMFCPLAPTKQGASYNTGNSDIMHIWQLLMWPKFQTLSWSLDALPLMLGRVLTSW